MFSVGRQIVNENLSAALTPKGFAVYFSLGFETPSTEMLLTKLNI